MAKLEKANDAVGECERELAAQVKRIAFEERRGESEVEELTALVHEAEMSLINIKLQVASVESKWLDAQQAAEDAQANLERVSTVRIVAPIDGQLQQFTRMLNLQEGDIICVIKPSTGDQLPKKQTKGNDNPAVRMHDKADQSKVASQDSSSWPAPFSRWPLARQLDDALTLASRLRNANLRLDAIANEDDGSKLALKPELSRTLKASQKERDAIVSVLQTKLSTRKELYDLQNRVVAQIKLRFDNGLGNKHDLMEAEESAMRTEGELLASELLIEFYSNIHARNQQSDRVAIRDLLSRRLSHNQKRAAIQQTIVGHVKAAVEKGKIDHADLADVERTLSQITSHSNQLELLIKHFRRDEIANLSTKTEQPSGGNSPQQAEKLAK